MKYTLLGSEIHEQVKDALELAALKKELTVESLQVDKNIPMDRLEIRVVVKLTASINSNGTLDIK